MEVVKIRLQSQYHSLADPLDVPKYVIYRKEIVTMVSDMCIGTEMLRMLLTLWSKRKE